MPEFDTKKINDSHDRLTLSFAGTSQEQAYRRIFPEPMPETHELAYRWVRTDPKRPCDLIIEPRAKGATDAAAGATPGADEPPKPAEPAIPGPPQEIVKELEKLDIPSLETRAAEVGVSVFLNGRNGKKLSQAQLVSKVAIAIAGAKEGA